MVAANNDGMAEEGSQVQECAHVGISCLKHDVAHAEDHSKEPSAPSPHLEDSSVASEVADPHGNDPALADDSITINPGDQEEESIEVDMQKEAADATLDSGKEPNGTPTAPVGDTGDMDDVTGANAESNTQEEIQQPPPGGFQGVHGGAQTVHGGAQTGEPHHGRAAGAGGEDVEEARPLEPLHYVQVDDVDVVLVLERLLDGLVGREVGELDEGTRRADTASAKGEGLSSAWVSQ